MEGSPTNVRSIAVHVEDLVNAYEVRARERADAVLRVTPPFSGRMRARLHVAGDEEYEPGAVGAPLHVSPGELLVDPPSFPTPDDTADELREDPHSEYDPDRHREYHQRRVAEWRRAVADSIGDRATVETASGPQEVDVVALGEWDDTEGSER